MGGFLDCSGRTADGVPAIPGATVADSAAVGCTRSMSILAALLHRNATGEGAYLDVAVADGVVALMSLLVDEHLATGADSGVGTQCSPAGTRGTTRTPARTARPSRSPSSSLTSS